MRFYNYTVWLMVALCVVMVSSCDTYSDFAHYSSERMLHLGDSNVYFSVTYVKAQRVFDQTMGLHYGFYKGQLISTPGYSQGYALHGEYRVYDRIGLLLERGQFKKGLKDGVWIRWNSSGNILSKKNYREGELDGKQFFYMNEQNGRIEEEYRHGILHGKRTQLLNDSIIHIDYFKNGGEVKSKKNRPKLEKNKKPEAIR